MPQIDRDVKKLIGIILAAKIFLLVLSPVSFYLFKFRDEQVYRSDHNVLYPDLGRIGWTETLKTWDANHYLYLADHGYKKGHLSDGFFPLFPLTIYLFTKLIPLNGVAAGLLLSNVFSLFGFLVFFRFVKRLYDAAIAFRATLYLLCFPTAFFFVRIYSESLFFLLVILAFYLLYGGRYKSAAVAAFFVSLTRSVGVFLAVPFLFFACRRAPCDNRPVPSGLERWAIVLAPVAGFLASLVIMKIYTGDWFEYFHAQQNYIAQPSVISLFQIPKWFLNSFFCVGGNLHMASNRVYDRVVFLLFAIFLWSIYRSQNKVLFLYAFLFGVIPPLTTHFMSFTRYIVMVFPVFIQMALTTSNHKRILLVMAVTQIIVYIFHSLGYWVA